MLDNLRRVAADFDNYRRRVAREQSQLYTRAGERVVVKLLPVLDDLCVRSRRRSTMRRRRCWRACG